MGQAKHEQLFDAARLRFIAHWDQLQPSQREVLIRLFNGLDDPYAFATVHPSLP